MGGSERGYWTVTRVAGAPLRVHWSFFALLLLLAASRLGPLAWAGCTAIIALHELAHLGAARRLGAQVLGVDLWALGGLCFTDGSLSPVERALVAAAGPGLNLLLAAVGIAVLQVGGPALGRLHEPVSAFAAANLGVGLLNLLPVPPMDGREALALPARWMRARAAAREVRRVAIGRHRLGAIDGGRGARRSEREGGG